jgi:hypothetical protein
MWCKKILNFFWTNFSPFVHICGSWPDNVTCMLTCSMKGSWPKKGGLNWDFFKNLTESLT